MVTVAMRNGLARPQGGRIKTSGLSRGPYCSAFAHLEPIFHGFSPRSRAAFFRDKQRCSAVAGASMIANPTPVTLRSAIALAILIRLLAAVAIIPARTGSPDVAYRWSRSPRAMKRDRSHGRVAIVCEPSNSQRTATKAEIVIVFVVASAIIGFSYLTANHAAANTPPVYKHDGRLHMLIRQCLQILRRQNG
jgi:hypothetical protein